jgi:hypothetical protein
MEDRANHANLHHRGPHDHKDAHSHQGLGSVIHSHAKNLKTAVNNGHGHGHTSHIHHQPHNQHHLAAPTHTEQHGHTVPEITVSSTGKIMYRLPLSETNLDKVRIKFFGTYETDVHYYHS